MASEPIVNPMKLETWLRANSAGIPCALLLGIEAMRFATFWASTQNPQASTLSEAAIDVPI